MVKKKKEGVKIAGEVRQFFLRCLQHLYLKSEHAKKCLSQNSADVPKGGRAALYRLVKAGYLKKQVIRGHEVYLLDKKGLDEIQEMNRYKLPLVQPHELKNIEHDLMGAHARFYFESHGALNWVSEREFRLRAGEISHIPDGAFTIGDNVVFLEVELTRKTIDRYRNIARLYTRPKGPDRVVYLYRDPSVVEPLVKMTRHHERLGFFPFDEEMPAPDQVIGQSRGREIRLDHFLGIAK
jgi:hypothetical protein